LIQTIDRNGRKRTYDYDALNRETAEHWLDNLGTDIRTFNYAYDAVGHLLTTNDPDSHYTYTYDLVDRVTSVDNLGTTGVPNVLMNYGYDAAGNLLSVTDSINGTLKGINAYSYDILNRVTKLTQSGTGVTGKRVDLSYDAVNRLTGINRYGDLAGTLSVADSTYAFDPAGRLQDLTHKRGVNTIASYGFTYDNANRITQSSGTDGTEDYSYDSTNQLTGANHTTQADEAYSYDANGNRTNTGYGTGTDNRLLTDGVYNYAYDDEGNRTKRTEIATGKVTEYNWDYRNRLSSVVFKDAGGAVVKTISYTYDVNDRRISKKIDGVVAERYVYDGANIALVFDGAGVQTHRYLYGTGVDQILADERGGSVVWALADNLGTVRDVVDGSGVVLNRVTYDSYGRVVSQTNPAVEFRYGYTGREQDNETGLDYYRARYYDSAVGRFISEDPLGFSAGDGNLYRYVGNSPTNFIDPSGLDENSWPQINLLDIVIFTGEAAKALLQQANPDGGRLNEGNIPPGAIKPTVTKTGTPGLFDPNNYGKDLPDFTRGDYNTGNKIPRPVFDPNGARKYKDFVIPQKHHTGHGDRCLNDILIPPFVSAEINPNDEQNKYEQEQDRDRAKFKQKDKGRHQREKDQIDRIMDELGIPKSEKEGFSQYLHQLKDGVGKRGDTNFTDKELRKHGREYLNEDEYLTEEDY
jgi:RHS repeat-associated protein